MANDLMPAPRSGAEVDWDAYPGEQRFKTVSTEGELDERAHYLLRRAKHQGGGVRERAKSLLKPYRDYRKARGEQPFQHLDDHRRREQARRMDELVPKFEAMFSGVDSMTEALPEDERESFEERFRDAPNPEGAKMEAANKLAVEAFTGQPADSFGDAWNVKRSQVARALWDTRGVVGEEEFYRLAGQHFTKEREKIDERQRRMRVAERASELGMKAAMRGQDWYEGAKASMEDIQSMEELEEGDRDLALRAFREANREARTRLGDVPGKARRAFQYLARRGGKGVEESFEPEEQAFEDDEQFAEWAAGLSDEDFRRVLEGVSILGEGNEEYQGMLMQMSQAAFGSFREFGEALGEFSASDFAGFRRSLEEFDIVEGPIPESISEGEGMRRGEMWEGGVLGNLTLGRDLTEKGREAYAEWLREQETRAERLALLRSYQSEAAPTVAGSWLPEDVEMGLYDATRSGLYTAAALAGPVGLAVNAQVMTRQNETQLLERYPEMDAVTRGKVAATAGALQAAEETVLTRFAFGKMKGLRKAFSKLGAGSAAKRFGVNLAAGTAAEMFEEKLQQATLPAVQTIMTGLQEDAPEVDWKREWKEIAGGNARLFFAVLPMTLIGAGVATHADVKGYRRLTEDRKTLEAARLADEDIEKIVNEDDLAKRDELIRDAYQRRDKELMREDGFTEETVEGVGGIRDETARREAMFAAEAEENAARRAMAGQTESAVDEETGATTPVAGTGASAATPLDEEMNFWADLERRGVLPEIRREGQWYRVTTPDGDIENFESLDEASEWSQGWLESLKETPGSAAREYAAFLEEYHGEAEATFDESQPTLADRVRDGAVSLELAEARARLAGIDDVSRAHVFGENRLRGRGRHARMMVRIYRDGDPLTVGEEFAEGFLKRHFSEGTEDAREIEDMIRRYEEETGRSYLPEDPDSLSDAEREQGVIEAFSLLGTEYLAGNLDARTLPEKLARWFELLFDTVLAKVMEGARAMRAAKEAGQLDQRLETLLAEAMGISEAPLQRAMEAEQQGEADAMTISAVEQLRGRLPHPDTLAERGDPLAAEAREVYETMRADESAGASQAVRTRRANEFFLPKGEWVDPDQVRESANEAGFDLDTPGEMWEVLHEEAAHGRATTVAETGVSFRARAIPGEDTRALDTGDVKVIGPADFSIRAYHGTPHEVGRFSTRGIGSGEGVQAFGWGLYFAENREVAEQYRVKLGPSSGAGDVAVAQRILDATGQDQTAALRELENRRRISNVPGSEEKWDRVEAVIRNRSGTSNLYTVELNVDEETLLDWDAEIREMPSAQRSVIIEEIARLEGMTPVTGADFYQALAEKEGSAKAASKRLASLGIKGIRYRDGFSRDDGGREATRNFVVFDENDIAIRERNGAGVRLGEAGLPMTQQVGSSRERAEQTRIFRRLDAQLKGDTREATPATRAAARSKVSQPRTRDPVLGNRETRDSTVAGNTGLGHVTPSLEPLPAVGKPVTAPEVVESLTGVLRVVGSRVPLRVGRVKRGVLGSYYVRQRLIRLRTANDITTAAHEVAHALEDAMFGRAHDFGKDKLVPDKAKDELMMLGRALYGERQPAGGYHSEGFAEFFRIFVEGGYSNAQKHAPAFSQWFDEKVLKTNPKLKDAVEKSVAAADTWNKQGAVERAKRSIAPTQPRADRMRESGLNFLRTFDGRFIDMAFPLKRFVEEAEARGGSRIPTAENPWDTLNARRMTADSVTAYMVEHGMLDFWGNKVGKSLEDVVAPVKGREEDFLIYLWARRTAALEESERNSGLSQADAAHIIAELDSPAFQTAAQGVYDWNNGVLDYAAQASPDYERVVGLIRDADPGQYIPLFREFKAFDERYRKLATDAKSGQLVKRLKGSGRRIKNPVESMIGQARALVMKAQQKAVLDQIVRIADNVEGLGDLVFEVPKDMVPGATRDTESVLADVARQMKANGASEQLQEAFAEVRQGVRQEESVAEALITFFVPAQTAKPGEDPIIPIYQNGERRWFEVSRNVYEAINGMEVYRMPRVLDLFFGLPARTLRLGTTGLRASFSLVTNPLRDFRTLHLNSQANANTGELFFEWMRQVGSGALDAATGGRKRSEWIDLFERLGGQMATPLGQDTLPAKRARQRLFAGRAVRTVDPRNWLDFARDVLQFPEKASRIAEMKFVARDMGWSPEMPLDAETAARLITAGKQVTTDFTAAGNVSRVLNQALPFFNAQIQGPRAHVRAIQRNPGKFAVRALTGTALALALWWRYRDEDWWKEMPASEKYGYTYIPFDTPDGRKELVRIPRSFEADGIFMAGAQALADAWYQERPGEAGEWFGQFMRGFEPSLPPLVENVYEQAKNEDLYFQSPIIPRGEQDMPEEEQFSDWTTTLAIKLGDITGTSPRRIDHSVRNLFGGVGTDIMSVFGRGETGDGGDDQFELADIPVFGTLFQRGGRAPRGAKSIDGLYERLDMAKSRQRSKREEESEEERQLRLQLNDAARAISYVSDVQRLEWSVEKRRELDRLRIEIARDAVEAFESEEVNRERFKAWRKEWAALATEAEKSASMSR